jgi:replicative DNA helicase
MSVKCAIPKNDSAERAVIACLLDEASVYRAPLTEAHFAAPDHQLVFRAVLDLTEAQQPVSIMSVRSKLESRGELENAGGDPSRFFDCGGGGGDDLLHYHFPLLESARRNREAILHIHKHLSELTSLRIDAAQFAEELSQIAAPVAVSGGGDSVADIVADIEARELLGEKRDFFTSGLDALDNLLRGGFVRGNLGVYAGRTGGGKSVGLVQSAVANAKVGRRVIYYTTELGQEELVERAAACYRGVSLNDAKRLRSAMGDLAALPLVFRKDCGVELHSIAADIRAEVRAGKCDMAVVDYIQRVSLKADSRELEVSGVARKLKDIAVSENIPVLTASQLNDEGRLRESRNIGMEADVVILIKDESLVVNKSRRGPQGDSVFVNCRLQGERSRFVTTDDEPSQTPF